MSQSDLDDPREVIRRANIVYFRSQAYEQTTWMGIRAAKCPMDMWIYQEIITSLGVDLLVETGTLMGGSALFFAHVFDLMGKGEVITVDIEKQTDLPDHPRIRYINGSSIDTGVLDSVQQAADKASTVMVILDSDHKAPYKYQEMMAYRGFVTPGSYLIAEDTCFDFYPAWPEYGPGPATAVTKFLENDDGFEMVREWERHLLTFSPGAFLRKRV